DNFSFSAGMISTGYRKCLIGVSARFLDASVGFKAGYSDYNFFVIPDFSGQARIGVKISPVVDIWKITPGTSTDEVHWKQHVVIYVDGVSEFDGEIGSSFTESKHRFSTGLVLQRLQTEFHFNDLTEENCSYMTKGARGAIDNFRIWVSPEDVEHDGSTFVKWIPGNQVLRKHKRVCLVYPNQKSVSGQYRISGGRWRGFVANHGRLCVKLPKILLR